MENIIWVGLIFLFILVGSIYQKTKAMKDKIKTPEIQALKNGTFKDKIRFKVYSIKSSLGLMLVVLLVVIMIIGAICLIGMIAPDSFIDDAHRPDKF